MLSVSPHIGAPADRRRCPAQEARGRRSLEAYRRLPCARGLEAANVTGGQDRRGPIPARSTAKPWLHGRTIAVLRLGLGFRLGGLARDCAMDRSPSVFSDSSVRPSFLRTTPAKNPRTECCCQPVAFMISGITDPCGRLSSAITFACLEFARDLGWAGFLTLTAFGRLLVADAAFTL